MRRVAMTAALAALAGVVTAVGVSPQAAAGVSPGQTLLASLSSDQEQSLANSFNPAVSGDGRWVVFSSQDQLDEQAVQDDTPTPQIYVRDLVNNTTRLLSFTYSGDGDGIQANPASGTSDFPAISGNGRYVAFQTNASLAGGTGDQHKIVMVDRDPDGDGDLDEPVGSAITATFTLIGAVAPSEAFAPSISDPLADGSVRIAYETSATGFPIVAATATPTATAGAYSVSRQLVRPRFPGLVFDGAWAVEISGNGQRVVAMANYDLPPPPPPEIDFAPTGPVRVELMSAAAQPTPVAGDRVVAFDLADVTPAGDVDATRIDVTPAGAELGLHLGGNEPHLTDDGTTVVFEIGVALPLCPGCEFPSYEPRAFIAGLDATDAPGPLQLLTVDPLSRDNGGVEIRAIMPAISGDGRYAAFVTDVPGAHNGIEQPEGDAQCAVDRGPQIDIAMAAQSSKDCQVVVRDLVLDAANAAAEPPTRIAGELASPSTEAFCADPVPAGDTCESDGVSLLPALSDNGGVVVYTSDASDLVAEDDNLQRDVFARRFTPTVQSDPIDFGGVQLGDSATLGTVVTPVGFGPLTIESVTVTGAAFTLDLSTCAGTLHIEDSCAATVTFTPPGEGVHVGTLDVKPAFIPPPLIAVGGLGTPFPQPDPAFEVAPEPLDFGERLVLSDSAPGVITVTNGGIRVIVVDGVSLPPLPAPSAPGDYRIAADTCTGAELAPGGTCTVTLVHQPQGAGARPAVLQFDQAVPGPAIQPHLVELLGAGTAPRLQVNPAVVPVGRITNVIGTGFPANRAVSVRMPGFPEVLQFQTGPDGTFTEAMLVYPKAVPGSRVVEVAVDDAPTVGDTENLLVVPGSVGPPDFLARR